ncbi:SusC/RagA family TonB-linked outer membrane protein [Arcticibacter tournemirensis]|uniref:SusC/RagA family TonB-linked outer membrane protein n=2 Tax=Arcticibacter tournemirensis TaxID=699437 RepID=A0A4Q0MF14_9SPHI|nr:SusC/RagA family TonB-linked outer membrane protein [Arcticibacter tournemirensis]
MLNRYLKKCICGMLLLFCNIYIAEAQSVPSRLSDQDLRAKHVIKGTVLDEFGKPLVNASIKLSGGKTAVVTDNSGSFQIEGPGGDETIIVEHPDYTTRKIKFKRDAQVLVKMDESYLKSPEKVQVLYNTRNTKEILGAVTSIYNKQLTSTPTPLYLNALTGRLAGFYTQEVSGFRTARTTSITVNDLAGTLPNEATRYTSGISDNSEINFSLRGQAPVTIIDGVQRDIYSIDPEQIESVTVLKDALSTLLLGQKSSRGVLQVVTKKGVAGPPRISFTAQSGFQSALKTPRPLSAHEYAYLYNEALLNSNLPAAYSAEDFQAYRDGSSPYIYPDVNWYNTILKDNNPISKYSLNVNGGLKNARYSLALSYMNQQGMFKSSDQFDYKTNLEQDRYLINSNIDVDVSQSFTIGLQIFGRIQEGRQPGAGVNEILKRLYSTPNNVYPVFNENGTYGGSSDYITNLYQQTTGSGYLLDNNRDLMANLDLNYKLDSWLPGLYAKAKVNFSSLSSTLVNRAFAREVMDAYLDAKGKIQYNRFGSISDPPNTMNATSTAQLFYVQGAVGYNFSREGHSGGAMLFADQQSSTYQYDLPGKYTNIAATANYSYNNKYFAEAAVNYAGFDRFEPGNQFGLFYAAGLGWDVAQEDFFKDNVSWIEQFKLRGTFGKTGNSNENSLGYFAWRGAFGQDGTNSYPTSTSYSPIYGLVERNMANVNATWEKGHKLNIGLDIQALKHFTLNADYFRDTYYDLLQQRGSTTEIIGLSYPNENVGKNLYTGQELTLTYRNSINKFNYFITANASRLRTEVLYMDELQQRYPWNWRTGMPVGQTFGYRADGLIQTQEEADRAPLLAGTVVYPGDVKLVDLNSDGVIDQFDQTALGNTKPQINYGATLGFNIAGFDFSILLQGVKNRTYQQMDYSFGSGGKDQGYDYMIGRWTPATAATATYPRLTVGFNANNTPYLNNSSFWTHSGEYFRIRNIDVGYTLPYSITRKLRVSGLRLFANAQNLFTETAYERLDPEVYSNAAYPIQRTINAGVNIKL